MDHKLWVLQTTLQPLVSWRHDSMEVVVLCCNLLKLVMEKHTSEVALARQLVFLLCRIAFRHQVRGIKARADLLDPEMLRKLTAFVGDGNVEFINDLTTAFTSISWDEHKQGHIIWTVIDIPSTLLSPTSQSALITLFGTSRWSLVERLDRKRLADFVGRLPADMIVQQIVDDESVCVGWMRLLLFSTFRSPHRPDTPRALWRILLSAFPKLPRLFLRDLQDHLEPSETSLSDLYHNHNDGLPITKEEEEKEESLWMKLFWSSRFFELDCKSWFVFEDATVRLGQRRPPLLRQLEGLCFSLEKGLRDGSGVSQVETRAHMEITKVRRRVDSIMPPRVLAPQETPASAAARKQDTSDTEKPDSSQPQQVAPKDTRPADENPPSQSTQPPKIAPQDTPQFNPATRRQNTMTKIQVDLPQDSHSQKSPPLSPVRQTPPPQERTESPTLTDSDHQTYLPIQSRSREFLGVVSQLRLLPGGAVPPALSAIENSEGEAFSSLPFWMRYHERGYFDPSDPPAVAPRDTLTASPTMRRQSSVPSQVQDDLQSHHPDHLRLSPDHPPSQERSESPILTNSDSDQRLPPIRSGVSESVDAESQHSRCPLVLSDSGDEEVESSSGLVQ